MLCTKCKKEAVQDAPFCPWCGKKLITTKKTRVKSRGNGTGTAFKRGSTWTAQVVYDRVYVSDDKPLKKLTRSGAALLPDSEERPAEGNPRPAAFPLLGNL